MIKKKKLFNLTFIVLSIFGICFGIMALCFEIINVSQRTKKDFDFSKSVKKRVLFLASYSAAYYPTNSVLQGMLSAFFDKNDVILNDTEFMDARRYNKEENYDLFYKMLKYKLSHHEPYLAIMLGGDEALNFALKYQDELFAGIPMVFFAVRNEEFALKAHENPLITGEVLHHSMNETLDLAIKLYPNAKSIVAIYDDAFASRGDVQQFFALKKDFPSFLFRGLNTSTLSLEKLGEELRNCDSDDIILFLDASWGPNNVHYERAFISDFIMKNVKMPIFCIQDEWVKNGFLGGAISDFYKMGRQVAATTKRVISGEKPKDIPVTFAAHSKFCFNYDTVKKFNINMQNLPADSLFLNRSESYWKTYKKSLLPIICILVSLAIILAVSGIAYNDKKSYAYKLQKSRLQLLHSARHDFLTGLANRHYAHSTLQNLIKEKKEISLLLIDIDNFKSINDFFSHTCGDEVLKEVARRLQGIAQSGDYFVSRFGGDEFLAIYKNGILTGEDSEVEKFKQALDGEFVTDNKRIIIHSSIGVATTANLLEEDDDMVAFADFALYYAKNNGRNMISFFNAIMNDEIKKQKKLAEIVEDACQNDGFTVLYQPQMNAQTGQIHGYEALVRLKDSYISPADFIPVAEKNGFIGKIGRIVTKKVIQQIVQWRDEKLPLYTVSINYSSGQMGDAEYVQYLHNLLIENEINPQLIKIEITESLCMKNTRQAMSLFNNFSQIGVKLALDDFGTGFSSLSYLTYLPVDTVKIDKTMTDTYLIDGKDDFIENIISLVHSLGMKLTAEGVEQQWQYDRLKKFQCDSIQGYFFSRPITGEVVCESLHDGRF